MRLLVTSLFLSVLLSFPGCLSDAGITDEEVKEFIKSLNDEDGDFLENIKKIDALSSLAELVEELAEGNITDTVEIRKKLNKELDDLAKTSPTIKKNKKKLRTAAEKYVKRIRGTIGLTKTDAVANKEDIKQTKADLERLATSFNFMKWYGQTPSKVVVKEGGVDGVEAEVDDDDDEAEEANGLKLADFEDNEDKGEHVIESPYFWVSFWNGYEAQKNASSNALNETAIKKIFEEAIVIGYDIYETGLREFVRSIIDFATEASKAGSMSTKQKAELSTVVTDLEKGNAATSPVTNLENLILHCLHYSINKKLQECNVFAKTDSGEFYLKNGIFTKDGVKKSVESKDSEDLTNLASESIRSLMILKESIDKKMITTSTAKNEKGKKITNKAKVKKDKQVTRLDGIIKKMQETFEVKTEFIVHTDSTKKHTSILTKEESTKVGGNGQDPLSIKNEILEGGTSTFLNSIRESNNVGLIPDLIATASTASVVVKNQQ